MNDSLTQHIIGAAIEIGKLATENTENTEK